MSWWVVKAAAIRTWAGTVTVSAQISPCGLWAVHPRFVARPVEAGPSQGDEWTLTHLPTGFALFSHLPSISSAKELAARVTGLADWSFDQPDNPPLSDEQKWAVRNAVMEAVGQ